MSQSELPDYAKEPWSLPEPPPKGGDGTRPQAQDPLTEKISQTHQGVAALQVLLEKPEAGQPSKIDVIVDLLEAVAGQQKALVEGLDLLFYRQNELFRAMALKIPAPPARPT